MFHRNLDVTLRTKTLTNELNARHPDVLLMTIKIYKYRHNTTDLLYSTTSGLRVSTP